MAIPGAPRLAPRAAAEAARCETPNGGWAGDCVVFRDIFNVNSNDPGHLSTGPTGTSRKSLVSTAIVVTILLFLLFWR